MARKRTYFTALCHSFEGLVCGVHRDDRGFPFQQWLRVSAGEYEDLRREGFRVRKRGRETTRRR